MTATLLAVFAAVACSSPGTDVPPIGPTPPTPVVPPNSAPKIVSVAISAERVEVGEQVSITATVQDEETNPDDLKYQWTVTGGSIAGIGRNVRWTAPTGSPTPASYKVSLTVIDQYTSAGVTLENRVTADAPDIHVNDSPVEAQELSEDFLLDFVDSTIAPETCLRNFSDSCAGKERERKDIVNNRQVYVILSYSLSNYRVSFNISRTRSTVLVACRFNSRIKETGALEVATGTCELQLIYDKWRWWLCESSYHKGSSFGPNFIF